MCVHSRSVNRDDDVTAVQVVQVRSHVRSHRAYADRMLVADGEAVAAFRPTQNHLKKREHFHVLSHKRNNTLYSKCKDFVPFSVSSLIFSRFYQVLQQNTSDLFGYRALNERSVEMCFLHCVVRSCRLEEALEGLTERSLTAVAFSQLVFHWD